MKGDFHDSSMQKDPAAFPPPRRRKPPRKGQEPTAPKIYALGPWLAKTLMQQTAIPVLRVSAQSPETAIAHQDSKWWRLSQLDSAVVSNADGTARPGTSGTPEKARALLRESHSAAPEAAPELGGAAGSSTAPTCGTSPPGRLGSHDHA